MFHNVMNEVSSKNQFKLGFGNVICGAEDFVNELI